MKNLFWVLVAVLIVSVASADEVNSNIGGIVGDVIAGVPSEIVNDRLKKVVADEAAVSNMTETVPMYSSSMPGDVTRDGVLDIGDVVMLLRGTVGLEWHDDSYYLLGDLTPNQAHGDHEPSSIRYAVGDGRVDIGDVVAALRASVGIIQLRWPTRAIYIEAHQQNSGPVMAQGLVAKCYGPYAQLATNTALSVADTIRDPQESSFSVTEVNDYYLALAFVGSVEVPVAPGQAFVKMSWEGPRIGFGGPGGYQTIEVSDRYSNVVTGYRCDEYPIFQFRYATQVPGFSPTDEVYDCAGRG